MSYKVERPMKREEVEALLHELMPSKTCFTVFEWTVRFVK